MFEDGLSHAKVARTLTECDRKLARHRAALEAGGDPALAATWGREVRAERAAAEAWLTRTHSPDNPVEA